MSNELQHLSQFEGIRKYIDESEEIWYCVVDVVEVLSESVDPNKYWADMKRRDKHGELSAICRKFPIPHRTNGRRYKMDCAGQQGILQIIQLIPSPKAEPFRSWLAMTGSRRLDEIRQNPIEAERERLRLLGFSEKEIEHRLARINQQGLLRSEWSTRGVAPDESEILTDEIHKGTFDGMTRADHADHKRLEQEDDLYDHMTSTEVAFSILGEAFTMDEIRDQDPKGFDENKEVATQSGERAGRYRETYEEETGRKVISDKSILESRKALEEKKDQEPDNGQ